MEGKLRSYANVIVSTDLAAGVSDPARWLGVDVTYLVASLTAIGFGGFLSLGMLGPMLWPGRGQQDTLLLVMVIVGLFRTFAMLYDMVKRRSGTGTATSASPRNLYVTDSKHIMLRKSATPMAKGALKP